MSQHNQDSNQKKTNRTFIASLFETHIRSLGLRQTKQRDLILATVFDTQRHFDAELIAKEVKKRDPSIGIATVYRTLKMMTDAGILEERHFHDNKTYFEFIDEEQEHHDHLICNQCGKIVEFLNQDIENLQIQTSLSLGFQLTHHKMELFADCLDKTKCISKETTQIKDSYEIKKT